MSGYLKLVHMEVYRFRFILAALMAIITVFQFSALIWFLTIEIPGRQAALYQNGAMQLKPFPLEKLTFAEVIFNTQFWFMVPILLSIAVLSLYVFLIWYRDWFGRNTFIYRLLMLPAARRNIYLAKGTAILLFVFGLITFQLLLLPIEHLIFKLIIPAERIEPSYFVSVISSNQAFVLLLPRNFDQFAMSYTLGMMAVLAIFTAILLERSYRIVGIVYALLYLFACVMAIVYPMFTLFATPGTYLYPTELFGIELAMCGIVIVGSLWLGFWLLSKKITV